jgi:RNA polymerase sigma-70 factor (ECF subfamily)
MTIAIKDRSEEQLVEAAQNGHLESFGALYQRYYSSMVALAYSVLGDRDCAEDAAQEVFAIACHQLTSLKHRDKFGAWLAGICRNTARQMLRVKGKTMSFCDPAKREPSDMWQPTENTDTQEHRQDAIRQAVWKLPPAERELVVLRYYNGFSHAQISRVLDISASAVNGRLIRAKRKIAAYLKHNGFTGEYYETS